MNLEMFKAWFLALSLSITNFIFPAVNQISANSLLIGEKGSIYNIDEQGIEDVNLTKKISLNYRSIVNFLQSEDYVVLKDRLSLRVGKLGEFSIKDNQDPLEYLVLNSTGKDNDINSLKLQFDDEGVNNIAMEYTSTVENFKEVIYNICKDSSEIGYDIDNLVLDLLEIIKEAESRQYNPYQIFTKYLEDDDIKYKLDVKFSTGQNNADINNKKCDITLHIRNRDIVVDREVERIVYSTLPEDKPQQDEIFNTINLLIKNNYAYTSQSLQFKPDNDTIELNVVKKNPFIFSRQDEKWTYKEKRKGKDLVDKTMIFRVPRKLIKITPYVDEMHEHLKLFNPLFVINIDTFRTEIREFAESKIDYSRRHGSNTVLTYRYDKQTDLYTIAVTTTDKKEKVVKRYGIKEIESRFQFIK